MNLKKILLNYPMALRKSNSEKKLVVILGPTAVGKTAVSIDIAKYFKCEIISADSRQFFKELKIGSAQPSHVQLSEVRHHFIANLNLADYYNASIYEYQALKKINELFQNNNYVVMVGGSGLYIDAVCRGLDDLPDPNAEIRLELNNILEVEGIEALRFKLRHLDPVYYSQVDLANPKRLIRALEVCILSGRKFSELRKSKKKERNFSIIKIGLNKDRNELFGVINERVDQMVKDGLVEEAFSLRSFSNLNSLNTVGYKELFSYFNNKLSLAEAITNIKTNTRRFAKRQITWFMKDSEVLWTQPIHTDNIIKNLENH